MWKTRELRVLPEEEGLCPDDCYCRAIGQALPRNHNLRILEIMGREVRGDSLDGFAECSSLQALVIRPDMWTPEGLALLARQMRASTALEKLPIWERCWSANPNDFDCLEELVRTYNYTLRVFFDTFDDWHSWRRPRPTFHRDPEARIAECLMRNARIRRGLEQLQGQCRVAPVSLVPVVLDLVGGLPTIVYRFLRRGDLMALCS
jgi:hypothetical protein